MEGSLLQLIILSTCLVIGYGFEIDTHSEDQSVNNGDDFVVECHVTGGALENKNWKHCVWTREADQASCTFTYLKPDGEDWQVQKECDPGLSDINFRGDDPNVSNLLCGMDVASADALDNGVWTCDIEQCTTAGIISGGCAEEEGVGNYISATMNVEVQFL